jgi:uncharacterized protein (DUF2236 family)
LKPEAPSQAPGPGSLIWRYGGDPRILNAAGYALLLQLAHPTVAAGVRDHSDYANDPWGRLLRSADYLYLMAFGGQEAAERTGAALRAGHEAIRGEHADGRSYNAFEPAAWSWVHATLADAAITGIEWFARPLTADERNGLWRENLKIGEIVGVTGLPDTWDGYLECRSEMITTTLRGDVAIDDFMATLARQPLGRLAALPAVGLLPGALRLKCGLRWTYRNQGQLEAFARASRALTPLMIGPLRNVGPAYLRVRKLPR